MSKEHNPFDMPAKMFIESEVAKEEKRKPRKPRKPKNDPNTFTYDVLVGNVGFALTGATKAQALVVYAEYVHQSESGVGRAGGEDVTLFNGDDIVMEHSGSNGRMLDAAKMTHILKNLIVEAKDEHRGFDHFSSMTESVTNGAAGLIVTLKNGSKFHVNVMAQEFSRKT